MQIKLINLEKTNGIYISNNLYIFNIFVILNFCILSLSLSLLRVLGVVLYI